MKEEHLNKLIILLLTAFLVLGFIIGCQWSEMRSEGLETIDTVTVVEFDTVTITKDTTITKFIPKKVEVIRTDTITKDTILITEQKIYEDTLCNDKDSIILQSFITGINSSLDSTSVVWRKHKETITNTVYITKYIEKKKTFWNRFNLQPQITSGYDLINHKWGIIGGIGVGIDIGGK
mgnify:CR=1 FL=1